MKNQNQKSDHILPFNYKKDHADHLQSPTIHTHYTGDFSDRNLNPRPDGEPALRFTKSNRFANKDEELKTLNKRIFKSYIMGIFTDNPEIVSLYCRLWDTLIGKNIRDFINSTPQTIKIHIDNLANNQ